LGRRRLLAAVWQCLGIKNYTFARFVITFEQTNQFKTSLGDR
jgi:hypothetical protein